MVVIKKGKHLCSLPNAYANEPGTIFKCDECDKFWGRTTARPYSMRQVWKPLWFQRLARRRYKEWLK
jgi:hypothetical protein